MAALQHRWGVGQPTATVQQPIDRDWLPRDEWSAGIEHQRRNPAAARQRIVVWWRLQPRHGGRSCSGNDFRRRSGNEHFGNQLARNQLGNDFAGRRHFWNEFAGRGHFGHKLAGGRIGNDVARNGCLGNEFARGGHFGNDVARDRHFGNELAGNCFRYDFAGSGHFGNKFSRDDFRRNLAGNDFGNGVTGNDRLASWSGSSNRPCASQPA